MSRVFFGSLFFLAVFFSASFITLPTAQAATAPIVCYGKIVAGVCIPGGTGLSEKRVDFLLLNLMWWLLAVVGMIAIIAFVISGMQYLLSAGDEGMIETAKRNMTYSIVGVLVALSGWVIIRTIDSLLNGGLLGFITGILGL